MNQIKAPAEIHVVFFNHFMKQKPAVEITQVNCFTVHLTQRYKERGLDAETNYFTTKGNSITWLNALAKLMSKCHSRGNTSQNDIFSTFTTQIQNRYSWEFSKTNSHDPTESCVHRKTCHLKREQAKVIRICGPLIIACHLITF